MQKLQDQYRNHLQKKRRTQFNVLIHIGEMWPVVLAEAAMETQKKRVQDAHVSGND